MTKLPVIGISIGDIYGIGPEIILKTVAEIDLNKSMPVILAPKQILDYYADKTGLPKTYSVLNDIVDAQPGKVQVLQWMADIEAIQPGQLSPESGKIAMKSVEIGIQAALKGDIDALVTAPISKEAVNLAGYNIPGHTEFLAEKTRTGNVLMVLLSGGLRVALVTGHIPVKEVTSSLTQEIIIIKARILHQSLKEDFGISKPKMAILGLNPHAGDGGVVGREEIEIISPAIKALNDQGIQAAGPFPADGFFGRKLYEQFDAVLAMYHDQGLAPFKLLSFGKGVNFTAGLPIIRTSPDHGTAFDIAGKGTANHSSMIEAYNTAVQLAEKKVRGK